MAKKKKKAAALEPQESEAQEPAVQDPDEDEDKRERDVRLSEVYRSCYALFHGNSVNLSERSQIRDTLIANQSVLHGLFWKYGEIKLIESVQTLIDNWAFEADFCAKLLLPRLDQTAQEQDTPLEASKSDAAGTIGGPSGEMSQAEDEKPSQSPRLDAPPPAPPTPLDTPPPLLEVPLSLSPRDEASVLEVQPEGDERGKVPSQLHPKIPSLYPSYLPFATQHVILTTAQKLLEDCCFDFASQWIPDVLQKRGWECSSAVELTKWVNIFETAIPKLPPKAISVTNMPLGQVLAATHKIRHTAVHRLPVAARGVNQLLRAGMILAKTLQDFTRASQLEDMIRQVEDKVTIMEFAKDTLEAHAASQLEDIRQQREDLDRQEKDAIENMLKADRDQKIAVGGLIETAVNEILERKHPGDQTSDEDEADAQDVYFEVEEEEMDGGSDSLNNANSVRDSSGLWERLMDAWSGMTFHQNQKSFLGGFQRYSDNRTVSAE
ncbi:hypothetical protein CNYM01_06017 [Colletotrichum nymphaeae SA-01]|uniref:Ubiquinol-cytochrome-c reductase cytochrome c1 n=1 Tax=Colletotrichum nymphaeae SA-01 TaxID=1460502 RepID=A0A135SSE4_9PEZI|nr:hypothetical protein CNYM01_06017 [Colletotrichum nymphaeae SA-01]